MNESEKQRLNWQMDEVSHRIGCEWEDLTWGDILNPDDGPLVLTLPNCATVEMDPDSKRDVDRAAAAWEAYRDTSAAMIQPEGEFVPLYIKQSAVVFGVTARILANLSGHGRADSSNAVY